MSRMGDEDPFFEGKATTYPTKSTIAIKGSPSIFYPRAGLIVLGLSWTYRLS